VSAFVVIHGEEFWVGMPSKRWTKDVAEARKYATRIAAESGVFRIKKFDPTRDATLLKVTEVNA